MEQARARVFISCGQSKETDEAAIASAIAAKLTSAGFEPYVAVVEQTLIGLRENIFQRLRESEYFIFIDFQREKIRDGTPPVYRGSLFSHQELAIASFLQIEPLVFQEIGVDPNDGIIRFLQANAIPFSDRRTLVDVVANKIRERKWNPNWRNDLVLVRDRTQKSDAKLQNGVMGRFFHINVHNRHHHKMARNCYVHFTKAKRLNPDQQIALKTVEFKWAGTVLPNIAIAPQSVRQFDAFFILHDKPHVLQFNAFVDSTDYYPRISGEGEYELEYTVSADNFPPARSSFQLKLRSKLDETTLI